MKRLNRYIIVNVLKIFIITEMAGLSLSLIIDFFDHMDYFTNSFHNFLLSFVYLALRIPYYFHLTLPLSFLISMLIVFILMIRGNELITIRTSGISTLSLMKPMITLSIIFMILTFAISEWIMPLTSYAAEYMYRIKIRKEESHIFYKNDRIWFKRGNAICNIDYFDGKNDKIKGVTVITVSDDYNVKQRIDADSGEWVNGSWLFSNVVERKFEQNGTFSKKTYEVKRDIIKEPPSVFKVVQKNPEEMGFKELSRYIKKLKRSGHDVRRYMVDLNNKIAFPFVNLIMVLTAFSVGLRYTKTKHISKGILSGMSIGILYWFFHSVSLAFGYSETFPPLFSAWLSNFMFLAGGIIGIVSLRT